jgi:hypothetical protein
MISRLKKMKLSIGSKVLIANAILILVFIISEAINLMNLRNSEQLMRYSAEVVDPSIEEIEDFIVVVTRSEMYITNWVYLEENQSDRVKLRELHNIGFPALRDRMSSLMRLWGSFKSVNEMEDIMLRFSQVLDWQKEIMETLDEPSDFNDFGKKEVSIQMLHNQILPEIYQILTMLEYMKEDKMENRMSSWNTVYESFDRLKFSVLSLGIILLIFSIIASYVSIRYISQPINYLSNLTLELADGKIPNSDDKFERTMPNDEIKTMTSALKKLIANTNETIKFAQNVGAGKYETQYQLLSEGDELGIALTEMRDNLAKAEKDGFIRNWTNTGIGLFADILRKRYDSQEKLIIEVLKHLVDYIKANQGAFFLIEGGLQGQEAFLEAKATIAWNKPKFLEKKFKMGEGLIGQAWQEKHTLYLTEIPDNHIEITSGLGHKNPNSILIVPLIFNNIVYGILEMASFNLLEKYEIEFVEKVCESFAATISNFRNDTLNTILIKDYDQISQKIKAKESEVLRANEMLKSGQEEIFRVRMEASEKEIWLNKASAFVEINADGLITISNTSAERLFGYAQGLNRVPFGELFLDNEEFKNIWQKVQKEAEAEDIVQLINRDFRKFSAKVAMSSRINNTGYVAIIQDLTEVKAHFYEQFQQNLQKNFSSIVSNFANETTLPKPINDGNNDFSQTNNQKGDALPLTVEESLSSPPQTKTD